MMRLRWMFVIWGIVLVVFALAALGFFLGFISELRRGDRLEIQHHWGGFGGGLGGWRLSNSLAFLLGALLFTGVFVYPVNEFTSELPAQIRALSAQEGADTNGSSPGGDGPPSGEEGSQSGEEGSSSGEEPGSSGAGSGGDIGT